MVLSEECARLRVRLIAQPLPAGLSAGLTGSRSLRASKLQGDDGLLIGAAVSDRQRGARGLGREPFPLAWNQLLSLLSRILNGELDPLFTDVALRVRTPCWEVASQALGAPGSVSAAGVRMARQESLFSLDPGPNKTDSADPVRSSACRDR